MSGAASSGVSAAESPVDEGLGLGHVGDAEDGRAGHPRLGDTGSGAAGGVDDRTAAVDAGEKRPLRRRHREVALAVDRPAVDGDGAGDAHRNPRRADHVLDVWLCAFGREGVLTDAVEARAGFALDELAAGRRRRLGVGVVVEWVADNRGRLREAAESTTSHGELLDVDPYVVGDNVFLRFVYDTKDAMGMNMATIATREAAEVIEAETPAEMVALSGNLCSDKKPAAINAVEGRGRTVTADVVLPRDLVNEQLDTTPEAMAEGNTRKNLVGSAKAASLGFNAHAANTVAAAFLATGQDAAQVVEGANAITTMDAREEGLYASVSLAALELGTVGGGTGLATQGEALEILGLGGGGDPPGANADAFAEVIATGALAGELSLVAAFCSRHLASAHEELGR